jgi:putative addiction module component (TIGR02574 family)
VTWSKIDVTADALIAEARKLSLAERLRIAEALFQSARDEQADLPFSSQLRDELDRRFADYQSNPDDGSPWVDVRDRIEQKLQCKK